VYRSSYRGSQQSAGEGCLAALTVKDREQDRGGPSAVGTHHTLTAHERRRPFRRGVDSSRYFLLKQEQCRVETRTMSGAMLKVESWVQEGLACWTYATPTPIPIPNPDPTMSSTLNPAIGRRTAVPLYCVVLSRAVVLLRAVWCCCCLAAATDMIMACRRGKSSSSKSSSSSSSSKNKQPSCDSSWSFPGCWSGTGAERYATTYTATATGSEATSTGPGTPAAGALADPAAPRAGASRTWAFCSSSWPRSWTGKAR